jgi:hypothetical protein
MPLLTVLGLLVVTLLLAQFEARAYAFAAAALMMGFVVQAIPWTPDDG